MIATSDKPRCDLCGYTMPGDVLHETEMTQAGYLLIGAGVVMVGFLGARLSRDQSSLVYFAIQFLVFAIFTVLLMTGGVIPYRPVEMTGPEPYRVFISLLEIVWWLTAAWLAVGFLRAFIVLGHKPQQAKLVQELLGALLYLAAIFGIFAYVFDLPVKGLLATSGALAIIIGLALQSSLGDVFSGIVLNLERPYRVGDWVILDDSVAGTVLETNWRATHILTGNQDVAIVPNSVIAKSKLVNCSSPTSTHGASIRIKLDPSLGPAAACNMLKEVLLGSTHLLRTPEPSVTIKDISAEMIDYELSYSVPNVNAVGDAQNELFDRVFRAAAVAGVRFAPRLAGWQMTQDPADASDAAAPARLLSGITLFSSLSAAEKSALVSTMKRKDYAPGDFVVRSGTVMQVLCVVSYGVLLASEMQDGQSIERGRLTPGIYFGEMGLLTGQAITGNIVALTDVVIYEISKEALTPLLKARPRMAEELSEVLATRASQLRAVLSEHHEAMQPVDGIAERFAATMKRLFALH